MSLKHLAIWLGIKKVKNLVQVLSDDVLITRIGKLSTSLINLKELQKCRWCKNKDGKWVVSLKALKKEIRALRKKTPPMDCIDCPPAHQTPQKSICGSVRYKVKDFIRYVLGDLNSSQAEEAKKRLLNASCS